MTPLKDWPMSHVVMLTGVFLALMTGLTMFVTAVVASTRVVPVGHVAPAAWNPQESWLLFVVALVTATFATKRLTWKPESPQNPPTDPVPPNPDPAKE
jgi:membrane protein implicated in regulation of membrane protease activity